MIVAARCFCAGACRLVRASSTTVEYAISRCAELPDTAILIILAFASILINVPNWRSRWLRRSFDCYNDVAMMDWRRIKESSKADTPHSFVSGTVNQQKWANCSVKHPDTFPGSHQAGMEQKAQAPADDETGLRDAFSLHRQRLYTYPSRSFFLAILLVQSAVNRITSRHEGTRVSSASARAKENVNAPSASSSSASKPASKPASQPLTHHTSI